jgi:peptidoglycan-associated lipoprotein
MVMAVATLLSVGCASKRPAVSTSNSAEPVAAASSENSTAQGGGVATVDANAGSTTGGALGPDGPLGSQRVIYFDFDSSDIRNEYVEVIAAHGKFLASNATVRVRLEGHTDERGQTVRRALALQGVQESQITTVSYGEERPAAAGSDENAYSKNRRVEIVYIN